MGMIIVMIMLNILAVMIFINYKTKNDVSNDNYTENLPRYYMASKEYKLIYIKADSKSYLNSAINKFRNNKKFKDYGYEIDIVDWNGNVKHESRDKNFKLVKDRRK
ncbi:hypothetical protein CPT_Machias_257 [Staphylococcus phage Machias]|nr:hypothetical protein CPT_Machias_257 [Staphylococcus phage Machias]